MRKKREDAARACREEGHVAVNNNFFFSPFRRVVTRHAYVTAHDESAQTARSTEGGARAPLSCPAHTAASGAGSRTHGLQVRAHFERLYRGVWSPEMAAVALVAGNRRDRRRYQHDRREKSAYEDDGDRIAKVAAN